MHIRCVILSCSIARAWVTLLRQVMQASVDERKRALSHIVATMAYAHLSLLTWQTTIKQTNKYIYIYVDS